MAGSAFRRIKNNQKHHSNWIDYYLFKYFGTSQDHFIFKGRSGSNIMVPRRMLQTYKECFFDETYHKGFPSEQIGHGAQTVVDIGANIGYFSLYMLSLNKGSKIYAYEPMPVNFKQLETYKKDQPGSDLNIFNSAVSGDGNASINLNFDESDEFTTSASINTSSYNPDSIEVPCTSLERIIKDNSIDRVDLLKLDCEGSEYSIIYNCPDAVLQKVQRMAIETHLSKTEKHNTASLSEHLKLQGFETNVQADIIWAWRPSNN